MHAHRTTLIPSPAVQRGKSSCLPPLDLGDRSSETSLASFTVTTAPKSVTGASSVITTRFEPLDSSRSGAYTPRILRAERHGATFTAPPLILVSAATSVAVSMTYGKRVHNSPVSHAFTWPSNRFATLGDVEPRRANVTRNREATGQIACNARHRGWSQRATGFVEINALTSARVNHVSRFR